MSYRGPGLNYKIRKTTTNNKTGDSYAITIPRVIAAKFEEVLFRLCVSGNSISFTSGCKISVEDIETAKPNHFAGGGTVIFK